MLNGTKLDAHMLNKLASVEGIIHVANISITGRFITAQTQLQFSMISFICSEKEILF